MEPASVTLLCVENDDIDQRQLREMIGSLNWSAIYASNGLDGYAYAQTQRFDAIIANQKMPDLTGLGMFKCVRKGNGPNAQTPFLISSWEFTQDDLSAARDLGVEALAVKPFVRSHLRDQILHLCRGIKAANQPLEPSDATGCHPLRRSIAVLRRKLFR